METASTVEDLQVIEERRIGGNRAWAPTPAEIREACLEIQRGWTPQEERARQALPYCAARIPGIDLLTTGDGWLAEREDETTLDRYERPKMRTPSDASAGRG